MSSFSYKMSKFNYDTELIEQLTQLDEKCVQIILAMKKLESRISKLEKIAKKYGIEIKNPKQDDACIIS